MLKEIIRASPIRAQTQGIDVCDLQSDAHGSHGIHTPSWGSSY